MSNANNKDLIPILHDGRQRKNKRKAVSNILGPDTMTVINNDLPASEEPSPTNMNKRNEIYGDHPGSYDNH